MKIFGNTAEKRAKDAAVRDEGERLQALPIADLAVEVMAAFGPDGMGTKSGHQAGLLRLTGGWRRTLRLGIAPASEP